MPSAPATRRCARWPTSRRPTSSTPPCGSSTSPPSPTTSGAASSCSRAARRRCTRARTPRATACSRPSTLAEQLGDSDLLGRAALSLGGFGLSPGIVDDKLVGVLEEALAAVDASDSALRARLLVRLAVAIYWSQQPDRREGLVDEAIAIARRLGDPATLAFVLDQARIATSGPDNLERELSWVHELFALSEQLGDHESAVRARVTHIDLLLELDDLPAADMAIATLDRIATDVRDPRARSYIPLHRARRALMDGRARRPNG